MPTESNDPIVTMLSWKSWNSYASTPCARSASVNRWAFCAAFCKAGVGPNPCASLISFSRSGIVEGPRNVAFHRDPAAAVEQAVRHVAVHRDHHRIEPRRNEELLGQQRVGRHEGGPHRPHLLPLFVGRDAAIGFAQHGELLRRGTAAAGQLQAFRLGVFDRLQRAFGARIVDRIEIPHQHGHL